MPGFRNIKQLVDAELNGAIRYNTWRKLPTQTTASGIWFDVSMSPGNPVPVYYASSPTVGVRLAQSTDGGIFHGANVAPEQKYLRKLLAFNATSTANPLPMIFCDYLFYYPFIDEGTQDEQLMINNFTSIGTFTVDVSKHTITPSSYALDNLTRVQFTSAGTLPSVLSLATDYWLIKIENTNIYRVATSLANARANNFIQFSDAGTGVHSVTALLSRYTTGEGCQMMAIVVAGQAGGQTFQVKYTNSKGETGRLSKPVLCNTQTAIGTILTTAPATAPVGGIGMAGPFIPLQEGDTGVQYIESVTMLSGVDIGLFTLVIVKPMGHMNLRGIDAPVEIDYLKDFGDLPKIMDDAYISFICQPNGTLAASIFYGEMTITWI